LADRPAAPYARNAKIHGTDQVVKIAASMAKFGWTCLAWWLTMAS